MARWWRARDIMVVGRVTNEGVCAEHVAGRGHWTARVRLSPWAQLGASPTDEPLEVEWCATTDELDALQRAWCPGREVRLCVRPGDALRARLVRAG